MNVRCSHCDEEVLGSVNRCWRCGQVFSLGQPSEPSPPPRHLPWERSDALLAEVLDSPASFTAETQRRESPFASSAGALARVPLRGSYLPSDETVLRPARPFWIVLVATSLALLFGLFGLALLSRVPTASLLLSALGIACGCLALSCGSVRAGILALLTCCFTAWLSWFLVAVALYSATYNVVPWSPSAPRSTSTVTRGTSR